jgi:hypothetical protein
MKRLSSREFRETYGRLTEPVEITVAAGVAVWYPPGTAPTPPTAALQQPYKPPRLPRGPLSAVTCGHPERKHKARGLCRPCYDRAYNAVHAEEIRAKRLAYHRAYRTARREGETGPWTWLDPWPSVCGGCGLPFDPTLSGRAPMAETVGHEPPITWLLRHPEYEGPLTVRPEHYGCNGRKRNRPDWELVAA